MGKDMQASFREAIIRKVKPPSRPDIAADIRAEVRQLECVAACLPRRQAKFRAAVGNLAEHRPPTVVELRRAVCQAERAEMLRRRYPEAFK
jgi:hypothetical protein